MGTIRRALVTGRFGVSGVLTLALAAGWLAASAPTASAAACSTGQQAFAAGAEQCYTVPAGVSTVNVVAIGGAGASGSQPGGGGAQVTAGVPVSAGETLFVDVGVGGGGGGSAGGGESDVRTCSVDANCPALGSAQDPRLVVAGGGGGGGAGEAAGAGSGGDAGAGTAGLSDKCQAGLDGGNGTLVSSSDFGGGGGTCTAGGVGGTGGIAGGAGSAGTGGAGGTPGNAGGGGGAGFFGGGGGGAGSGGAVTGSSGGGGGGGSSYGPAGSDFALAPAGSAASVTITPLVATASVSPAAGLTFTGVQPEQTLSGPQIVTIINMGSAPLQISGLSFLGGDAQDFLISADDCSGPIAPLTPVPGAAPAGGSCELAVRFTPQATGQRSAILEIDSNDPSGHVALPVSGTGGQLPQGPAGATGATGATGARGPAGQDGLVELVTCKTVMLTVTERVHGKRKRVAVTKQVCTTKTVKGPVKFTTGFASQAKLSRAGVTYAVGGRVRGGRQLLLESTRGLRPGRYTLILSTADRHGHKRTSRQLVEVS